MPGRAFSSPPSSTTSPTSSPRSAEFRRSSFEVKHRISIGGELAVEGSETRVWAAQDPGDPTKLKGMPIPAEVIERFKAA